MRAKAIKDFDHYEHRVFTGAGLSQAHFTVARRGSLHKIELADDFYIRPATSSGGYRIVFADEGPTIIYTLDEEKARFLLAASQSFED